MKSSDKKKIQKEFRVKITSFRITVNVSFSVRIPPPPLVNYLPNNFILELYNYNKQLVFFGVLNFYLWDFLNFGSSDIVIEFCSFSQLVKANILSFNWQMFKCVQIINYKITAHQVLVNGLNLVIFEKLGIYFLHYI